MTPSKIKSPDDQARLNRAELQISEKLFYASSIESFLSLLYKEINRKTKTHSLILYYPSVYFGPLQYICYSKGVFKSRANEYKALKTEEDSLYLARSLGRPIHHILCFPIATQNIHGPVFLFLELSVHQADKGRDFYHSFVSLIEGVVERLLYQEHLKSSVHLWVESFNSLEEPLAIFDDQKNLKSANKSFHVLFENKWQAGLQQESFQWQGLMFEKHSYPVNIKGDKYIIYHYVNITESLHLRNKMIQNIRQSALGQLGTNVAHQLNNPLTGVLSSAQLLLSQGHLNLEEQKDMQDIVEGVLRSQDIIANLLSFSRMDNCFTVCDLNTAVKKTMPFVKSLIYGMDFKLSLCSDSLKVKTQLGLLQQVVFNLLKNACQAVESLDPSSRQICVRTESKNNQALLYVEDSGLGIDSANYQNIFKPFWTTKKERGGTGLGLNISYDIIKRFKGSLRAGPSSLGGACFVLTLPLQSCLSTSPQTGDSP